MNNLFRLVYWYKSFDNLLNRVPNLYWYNLGSINLYDMFSFDHVGHYFLDFYLSWNLHYFLNHFFSNNLYRLNFLLEFWNLNDFFDYPINHFFYFNIDIFLDFHLNYFFFKDRNLDYFLDFLNFLLNNNSFYRNLHNLRDLYDLLDDPWNYYYFLNYLFNLYYFRYFHHFLNYFVDIDPNLLDDLDMFGNLYNLLFKMFYNSGNINIMNYWFLNLDYHRLLDN